MARISCDQCNMAFIRYGGISKMVHERGCPNEKKRWEAERGERGEWVKYVECFECGCEVEAGQECCELERA